MPSFDEKSYIVAIWFVSFDGGDWMGTLWRQDVLSDLVFDYRFRYHAKGSRDPFDGKDEKSGYHASGAGHSEEEMLRAGDMAASLVAASRPGEGHVNERLLIRGDQQAMWRALATMPWAHVKFERIRSG